MIHLSDHAAERYVERVKPLLARSRVKDEIRRLIDFAGEPQIELPFPTDESDADAYLEIAPGIWLALQKRGRNKWAAVTCLTNGVMSTEKRKRLNRRKADQRAARRTRNRKARNRPENHRTDSFRLERG